MKKSILLILLSFSLSSLTAQTTKSILAEVNLDSLVSTVEILTGVRPSDSFGTIPNRNTSTGKGLTRSYLEEKLRGYGLETEIVNYRPTGSNVVAVQKGQKYPDSSFIICAHYDSVDDYCADDNASGTSAVLEAARIFSKYKFDYTIVYALWDEEEKGLIGSNNYAQTAKKNGDKIAGALNMDMIGYDGNGDYLFEVHIGNNPINDRLSNTLSRVLNNNSFTLKKSVQMPGTDRSDHASFWDKGYPAILVTEGFENDDFNPAYHTSADKLELMRLDYFSQISQLVVGTIAELSSLSNTSSVENTFDITFDTYPNPTTDFVYLKKNTNVEIMDITVYNMAGRELVTAVPSAANMNKVEVSNLQSGIYLLVVNTANGRYTKTFVKL